MDYFTYLRGIEYGMPNTNIPYNFGYNLNVSQDTPWPLEFMNKSTQFNLNKLISGIKDSIGNEADDEIAYNKLVKLAPNDEQRKIINDIKDNEMLHGKILRKIFTELTGVVLPTSNVTSNTKEDTTMSYKDMLKEAMFGEFKAIERYREFLAYAPTKDIYNMIMYIITDEIKHAIKYSFLISLN